MLTIGEIGAGYGGLAMAVQEVLGGQLIWVSENAPGPGMILARRFPGVPNAGDMTKVPWEAVKPVDILCAGLPCQAVSQAGPRKGTEDERWLWDEFLSAVRRMSPRPGLLILENVQGMLTWKRGRAVASVIPALAEMGYMGLYGVVAASDAGAPHQRKRWFLAAENTDSATGGQWRVSAPRQAPGRRSRADAGGRGGALVPDTLRGGLEGLWPDPGPDEEWPAEAAVGHGSPRGGSDAYWGRYAPAIRRWERVLGRASPCPVEPGRTGFRLSPAFVEFMQGLPEGWVTDIPLSRREMLSALGNGVVPQQAVLAIRLLLPPLLDSPGGRWMAEEVIVRPGLTPASR